MKRLKCSLCEGRGTISHPNLIYAWLEPPCGRCGGTGYVDRGRTEVVHLLDRTLPRAWCKQKGAVYVVRVDEGTRLERHERLCKKCEKLLQKFLKGVLVA